MIYCHHVNSSPTVGGQHLSWDEDSRKMWHELYEKEYEKPSECECLNEIDS